MDNKNLIDGKVKPSDATKTNSYDSPQTKIAVRSKYKDSLFSALLITVIYFGSLLLVIALAYVISPMFAWLLIGYTLFFPVYIFLTGGVLFSTYAETQQGKDGVLWAGVIFGALSWLTSIAEYRNLLTRDFTRGSDDRYKLIELAFIILGGFGVMAAVKGYKRSKAAALLVLFMSTSFIWMFILTSNGMGKIAGKDNFETPRLASANRFNQLTQLPYKLYIPSKNDSLNIIPNVLPYIGKNSIVTNLALQDVSGQRNYLTMTQYSSHYQLGPDVTKCIGITFPQETSLECKYLTTSPVNTPIEYHAENYPAGNNYIYFFKKGSTYFYFNDINHVFSGPDQRLVNFINSLQPATDKASLLKFYSNN